MPVRIMIADDNAMLRGALRALIETRPDWQVCGEAANDREAAERAAELKPDMIILDLMMPEKGGMQAARDIVSAFPDLPILLYTACAFSPEAKLEARKFGIRDVINKEAAPEQLIGAIESLLPQRTGSATKAAQPASLPAIAVPESDPQPN
jgi:DNA-binding NarL/FixJ family response regulator